MALIQTHTSKGVLNIVNASKACRDPYLVIRRLQSVGVYRGVKVGELGVSQFQAWGDIWQLSIYVGTAGK